MGKQSGTKRRASKRPVAERSTYVFPSLDYHWIDYRLAYRKAGKRRRIARLASSTNYRGLVYGPLVNIVMGVAGAVAGSLIEVLIPVTIAAPTEMLGRMPLPRSKTRRSPARNCLWTSLVASSRRARRKYAKPRGETYVFRLFVAGNEQTPRKPGAIWLGSARSASRDVSKSRP